MVYPRSLTFGIEEHQFAGAVRHSRIEESHGCLGDDATDIQGASDNRFRWLFQCDLP